MAGISDTPILVPIEMEEFWEQMRTIIREELKLMIAANVCSAKKTGANGKETNGFRTKPLYDMKELVSLFNVSRSTIYEWVTCGILKPRKIRGRVYFLWADIEKLLKEE